MAQERNLGTARAVDDEEDRAKADLQRQMEAARENISQTVNEIKETVTTQYQNVRESVSDALDWREQFRRRPVAFSLGAMSTGFLLGYTVGGALKSDEESSSYGQAFDSSYDDYGVSRDAMYPSVDESSRQYRSRGASMSAAALTSSGAYGTSGSAERPSYSSGYQAPEETQEPEGPGLLDKFKESRAYDRLQQELGNVGNRFIEQLSTTAQTVVLPALFLKLKDLIGVDLSGSSSTSGGSAGQTGGSRGTTSAAASAGGSTSGSSYGTSQNQSYSVPARDREEYSGQRGSEPNAPGQTGSRTS